MLSLQDFIAKLPIKSVVGPIGMEFGTSQIKMAQLELRTDQFCVRACAALPYPESLQLIMAAPKDLKFFLQSIAKKYGFSGKRVVTGLPPAQVKTMLINYRINPGQGEADVILKVIRDRLDGELNEFVIDYMPINTENRSDTERVALVAIARREHVIAFLDSLRGAGFQVEAVEIGPLAIKRLVVSLNRQLHTDNVMIVNCGQEKSYLTVLCGKQLIFDREIDFGETGLINQVAASLDIAHAECLQLMHRIGLNPGNQQLAPDHDQDICNTLCEISKPVLLKLIDSVNQSLIYAASQTRGQTISRIYLLGSLAVIPGVDVLINTLVNIPVNVLNPFESFPLIKANKNAMTSEYNHIAVAMGMAMRGMRDG